MIPHSSNSQKITSGRNTVREREQNRRKKKHRPTKTARITNLSDTENWSKKRQKIDFWWSSTSSVPGKIMFEFISVGNIGRDVSAIIDNDFVCSSSVLVVEF